MNIFTNTKKHKKFILILVLLTLFNFFCPKQSKAAITDFGGNLAAFFYLLPKGLIEWGNNIFCDAEHDFKQWSDGEVELCFTPEAIIKGKFLLFDANIFEEVKDNYEKDEKYDVFDWLVRDKNSLRATIAGWYYSLVTFSTVALLSVLVYVGIRMIISTISQDKAKYKTMFKDWLVALCLLIVMHYIMIGLLNLTSMITEAIGTDGTAGNSTAHVMSIVYNIIKDDQGTGGWFGNETCDGDGDDSERVEDCRYHVPDEKGNLKHYTLGDAFSLEFFLILVTILTYIFAWKYLKREFTIIFLILLGPVSCITYPIDKISDGKAQAFNKWLTEFIYNVLIQPFHLLLYTVLVGSAAELATENILYGIACIAILIPAEKFVREMFGFRDKLGSPLGAMATGAIGSQLLSKIKSGGSSKSSGRGGDNNNTPTRLNDKTPDTNIISGGRIQAENPNPTNGTDPNNPNANQLPTQGQPQLEDSPQGGGEVTDNPQLENPENSNENPYSNGEQLNEEKPKRTLLRKAVGTVKNLENIHSQRMANKWGSTSRKRRWVNRGAAAAKFMARAGAGVVGAGIGIATGKGIKGAIAGATVGSQLAGATIDRAASVRNRASNAIGDTIGDYADGLGINSVREKRAFKAFKADKSEQEKAIRNFKKKHDGIGPTNKELDEEMKNRFELSRFGLSDAQIDKAVNEYNQIKDPSKELDEQALNQAALTSVLADRYKGKFEKGKDMEEALSSLTNTLGGDEAKAREILTSASKMDNKNIAIKLPPRKIPETFAQELLKSRGIEKPTQDQIDNEEELHVTLQDNGFDENQIRQLSKLVGEGEQFSTIVNKVVKVHAEWQKGKTPAIDNIIGKNAGTAKANQEIIERLQIEKEFGIKGENAELKVDAIRAFEKSANVKKEQRNLGAKAVNLELSQNDKNAMTDKEKVFASKYQELNNASKADLEKYIKNL